MVPAQVLYGEAEYWLRCTLSEQPMPLKITSSRGQVGLGKNATCIKPHVTGIVVFSCGAEVACERVQAAAEMDAGVEQHNRVLRLTILKAP